MVAHKSGHILVIRTKNFEPARIEENFNVFDFQFNDTEMKCINSLNENKRSFEPMKFWGIPVFDWPLFLVDLNARLWFVNSLLPTDKYYVHAIPIEIYWCAQLLKIAKSLIKSNTLNIGIN